MQDSGKPERVHTWNQFWYDQNVLGPAAYLITWTCRGTWLHGDERGSVDREHNRPDQPVLPEHAARRAVMQRRLKAEPVVLSGRMRKVVHDAIQRVCDHRRWKLVALNVRSNHVHAVAGGESEPERMLRDFKSWGTRALREAGLSDSRSGLWTRHGSTRYLWTDDEVAMAVRYVLEGQDDPQRFVYNSRPRA